MLKQLKNKLLLRLFGIKPKPTRSDLPNKLNNFSPVLYKSNEDFNNWSQELFIKGHRN
jgi:hypothetical protein